MLTMMGSAFVFSAECGKEANFMNKATNLVTCLLEGTPDLQPTVHLKRSPYKRRPVSFSASVPYRSTLYLCRVSA